MTAVFPVRDVVWHLADVVLGVDGADVAAAAEVRGSESFGLLQCAHRLGADLVLGETEVWPRGKPDGVTPQKCCAEAAYRDTEEGHYAFSNIYHLFVGLRSLYEHAAVHCHCYVSEWRKLDACVQKIDAFVRAEQEDSDH